MDYLPGESSAIWQLTIWDQFRWMELWSAVSQAQQFDFGDLNLLTCSVQKQCKDTEKWPQFSINQHNDFKATQNLDSHLFSWYYTDRRVLICKHCHKKWPTKVSTIVFVACFQSDCRQQVFIAAVLLFIGTHYVLYKTPAKKQNPSPAERLQTRFYCGHFRYHSCIPQIFSPANLQ